MTPFLSRELSRRQFMKAGLATAAVLCFPGIVLSRPIPFEQERSLSFYNLHTGERMETVFWSQGSYHPSALSEIDRFMRDFKIEAPFGRTVQKNGSVDDPDRGPGRDPPEEGFVVFGAEADTPMRRHGIDA